MHVDYPCLSTIRPQSKTTIDGLGQPFNLTARTCPTLPRPPLSPSTPSPDQHIQGGSALICIYQRPLPHGGNDYWFVCSWMMTDPTNNPAAHVGAFDCEPPGWILTWGAWPCSTTAVWSPTRLRTYSTKITMMAMASFWERFGAPYEGGRWLASRFFPRTYPGALRIITPTHYQHWTHLL